MFGYIDNLSITVANIRDKFYGVLKVSARLEESDELTIGSRNDEPMLNEIFQKIIHSIDKSKVREILNRWITVKESVETDYTFLWKIFAGIGMLFLIVGAYSYQLKLNNYKLKKFSREDALTKIGNKLKLNETLEDEYKYTLRYKTPCGIIMINIDDFKKINDTHGHLVGDEILKRFANILKKNIRQTDKLGRWGGEEFLIVCPNTTFENLPIVAEALREEVEKFDFGNGIGKITASFGLSILDFNTDIEKALNEADKKLYEVKRSGKNRVL